MKIPRIKPPPPSLEEILKRGQDRLVTLLPDRRPIRERWRSYFDENWHFFILAFSLGFLSAILVTAIGAILLGFIK